LSHDEWAVLAPLLPAPPERVSAVQPLGRGQHLGALRAHVIALAELDDDIDWHAPVDATIVRTHQHAAGARKGG
jgi:transposase